MRECEPIKSITIVANSRIENSTGLPIFTGPVTPMGVAINRISPSRATITLWIYPDSFGLHRRIRNDLVERGFSVAARPLPEGLAIRGSPLGTQSAAQ